MKTQINTIGFDIDSKLKVFIENKMQKLTKHNDDIINSEVILKVLNTQTGENKISEIKIDISGNEFFAKKTSSSFEESTDAVIDALKKQIQKHKEKQRDK